jgi:hypothetical protein
VSPDSIISTPWNPQSFNRYTYVLNNPLKYVDPTGHIVNVQGIGDINDISIDDWANLILMPSESVNKIMTLLQAYQTVRGTAPTETKILEDAKETYTIEWGNTGNFPDSKFDVNSGTIILNTNLQFADSFYISNQILGNVYDVAGTSFFPNLTFTRDDAILAYDTYATIGSAIAFYGLVTGNPFAIVGGTIIALAANIGSVVETYNNFDAGSADGIDVTVSWLTFLGGLVPGAGTMISGFQLYYDVQGR